MKIQQQDAKSLGSFAVNAGNPDEANRDHCVRCGTCCALGGPALHGEDRRLVQDGIIPLAVLYTIRKGEMTIDNVSGGRRILAAEIIKIRSRKGDTACVFYDADLKACGIYDSRPLECRVMKCWDTSTIVALYEKDRIVRTDILSRARQVLDLVTAHERKCSYETVEILAEKRAAGDLCAADEIASMIAFDESVRSLVSSQIDNGGALVDFLFGRPLRITITRQFGIKVEARI